MKLSVLQSAKIEPSMLDTRLSLGLAYVVAKYITHQKRRWHRNALPLTTSQQALLSRYFGAQDLARVRIAETQRLPIPNPPGYRQLREHITFDLPNPESVAAMTFDHVVVARTPLLDAIVFHEMVHVTQFRLLGVKAFAEQYVRGFLANRRYDQIPLEVCAFELEERFIRDHRPFDVEAEVNRRLGLGELF
jgi:hypothetical protein